MHVDEYIDLFEQIEVNLTNPRIQQVLHEENFDLEGFQNVIKNYISQAHLVLNSEGGKLFSTIIEKAKILLDYTKNPNFSTTIHNFFNTALYLSKHAPANENFIDENNTKNIISEEEFSIRYENLIDALKFEGEESNLSLVTASDKVSFQVYKTSNRSLAFLTRGGSINKATKAKLINLVYHNGNAKNLSYEPVIIEKILDNSIFNEIKNTQHVDLTEALREQLSKQKDELFIVKNELEKLQKNEEELSITKEQFEDLFEQSKLAKKEYDDAKDAAINDTKLKTSVSYWEEKQDKHKHRFWNYGSLAITLIIILIVGLYFIISKHNINFQTTPQNTNSISTVIDFNASQKEKNISKTTTLKSNINDTNQTAQNISLDNPIDYLHYFGWYALLIFASSSALWIIRITVKIALSNLHLSEDAHERVVMIKTYLAFISEGHGLEEKDKQLIMTSLFRPSNIGIIQDESSITVADIVSSLKGK